MKYSRPNHRHGILFTGLLICVAFVNCYGQSNEEIKRLRELQQQNRKLYDSVFRNDELKRNKSEYLDIISRSKSYVAFTLGYEIGLAGLDAFNADLRANSFPEMKNRFGALVFGYSRMNKKIAGNLLFNVVPGNKSSNAAHEISVRGAGATFDKGYAFIATDKMILHAFAGLGWQYHTIKVTEKVAATPVNDLLDIVQGGRSGKITQNTFHGIAGLQFDYIATYRKASNSGLQLGIRVAYNPILAKSKYEDNDNSSLYRPEIDWRKYSISLLVKFFSRAYFNR